ncbi:hypothetical protein B0H13DRAFT_1053450 [Mycena leptocephala]|nr:hypothetical protein B0H13DRAFT_1053450 [Mycena leptocephala]
MLTDLLPSWACIPSLNHRSSRCLHSPRDLLRAVFVHAGLEASSLATASSSVGRYLNGRGARRLCVRGANAFWSGGQAAAASAFAPLYSIWDETRTSTIPPVAPSTPSAAVTSPPIASRTYASASSLGPDLSVTRRRGACCLGRLEQAANGNGNGSLDPGSLPRAVYLEPCDHVKRTQAIIIVL